MIIIINYKKGVLFMNLVVVGGNEKMKKEELEIVSVSILTGMLC